MSVPINSPSSTSAVASSSFLTVAPPVSGTNVGTSYSSSWGCQMDALVSDLSLALDESQQSQRRRRTQRRRANQTG